MNAATRSSASDDLVTTFGRLVEAYVSLERQVGEALQRDFGIPHSWYEVMLRLSRSESGQLPMSALAEQIALTSGGVTRLLDKMIAAGYAERVPCASDRRVMYASLTDAGRAKLAEASDAHDRNLAALFAGLSTADRRQLDRLLDKLRAASLD
ncbi:MAG TPA: MarR family transcriptional regulator [Marmoricola sp.]|nr:MarR family transcriptional regulator [Marmoricola sp.]